MVRRRGKHQKTSRLSQKKRVRYFLTSPTPLFLKIDSLLPVHTNTPSFDITNTPNPKKRVSYKKRVRCPKKARQLFYDITDPTFHETNSLLPVGTRPHPLTSISPPFLEKRVWNRNFSEFQKTSQEISQKILGGKDWYFTEESGSGYSLLQ